MANIIELIVALAIFGYTFGAFRERLFFDHISLPYMTIKRLYREGTHLPWWRSHVQLGWWRALTLSSGVPLDLLVFIVGAAITLVAYKLDYTRIGDIVKTLAVAGVAAYIHAFSAGIGARRAGRKVVIVSPKEDKQ